MPIMAEAKSSKAFEIPNEGTIQAVLAQVKDLGELDTKFGKKHKVQFRWQVAENDSEGNPKLVFERFTLSLHEKAGLYKRIKSMFGKEPPKSLDLEKLVGTNAQLVITHASVDGKTYANVAAVLKVAANAKKLEAKAIAPKAEEVEVETGPITDQDIPF